jgi:hypothetical protein
MINLAQIRTVAEVDRTFVDSVAGEEVARVTCTLMVRLNGARHLEVEEGDAFSYLGRTYVVWGIAGHVSTAAKRPDETYTQILLAEQT